MDIWSSGIPKLAWDITVDFNSKRASDPHLRAHRGQDMRTKPLLLTCDGFRW